MFVARRRGNTCEFSSFNLHFPPRPVKAKPTVRRVGSEQEASEVFERTCAAKLADGYVEIVVDLKAQTIMPITGELLGPELEEDLIETERARRGAPVPSAPAAIEMGDRSELLRSVVTGRHPAVTLERYDGALELATGNVVACDPFDVSEARAFTKPLPKGRYSVVLSRVHQRNAAATVVVEPGEPTRWEEALPKGTKKRPASAVEFPPRYGYPVDSGCGSFMDDAATTLLDEDDDEHQRVIDELTRRRSPLIVRKVPKSGTLVAFDSGLGDGCYGTYFGYDGSRLICVTTDFGMLGAAQTQ